MTEQERDRPSPVSFFVPVLFDLGHVDVWNEIVGVGAEHGTLRLSASAAE